MPTEPTTDLLTPGARVRVVDNDLNRDPDSEALPTWLAVGTTHVIQERLWLGGKEVLKLVGSPSTWLIERFEAVSGTPRVRDEVLTTAQQLISGDREQTYGSAAASFARIAVLWTAILGTQITATDVARCMVALKLSRLDGDPTHRDSWIDIAGYAALGAEIAR